MQRIREIREGASISVSALAKKMGVTDSGIYHYERNRRKLDIDAARKIVHALNSLGANCTFDDVFPDPQLNNTPSRKTA